MDIKEKNQPLLTIAIPTYNRKKYLIECLQHVISQIENDIEILVYDNASTDGTCKFMNDITKEYTYIRYVRNEENIGPDGNFLKCLREGKGKYIHILSDDDILLDGSIKKIKECIINYQKISIIYLNQTGFEGEFSLSKCKKNIFDLYEDKIFDNKNNFIEFVGIQSTFISAIIFNKDLFNKIEEPEQYLNTYLFQSHILLKLISIKEKILFISKPCIAGRGCNSGGYNLFKVFSHYWKEVLFDTGIQAGFSKKTLKRVYNQTIKKFLSYWVIYTKTNETKFDVLSYGLLFKETYRYPVAWLYLYPFIIMPSIIVSFFKKIYEKINNIKIKKT